MTETSATEPRKPRLSADQLRPLWPVLALVSAVLALWLAWTAFAQYRAGQREDTLTRARDQATGTIAATVKRDIDTLAARLAQPPVQAALASGDLVGAAAAIGKDWAGVEQVEVLPVDLDALYAGLPKSGYGKLATLEAALAGNAPVAWLVDDGGPRLALAAPALAGPDAIGVAYVRFPVAHVTAPVASAAVGEESYLALRQGSHNVAERGDTGLRNGAEVLAKPVAGTDWRVAAALPDAGTGPFGLDWLACLVGALLFAGLAAFAARA
jgi:phosphomannomutase/phosphoglucomutase